jgi:c(7)-type cytochrome triheme protein
MRKFQFFFLVILIISAISLSFAQSGGIRKKRPPRHEYGNIIMNKNTEEGKIAPVVFKHWVHRTRYTCRLCHMDVGFSMQAGGTAIRESDNTNGLYCGSCHNGKEAFGAEEKGLLGSNPKKNCDRCHSYGKDVSFKYDFYEFTKKFPKARYGDKIDWMKTEETGLIKLKDYLEGVSFDEEPLKYSSELELKAKVAELPDIIFSHKKHSVWLGCEICHPDIFGIGKGETKYTMQDVFAGRFCGACHGKVAFANLDCKGCHSKDVY